MTKEEFLQSVSELLESEEPLKLGGDLDERVNWDSLGILSLIDFFEELGVPVDIEALSNLRTTDELVELAGSAIDA